MRERRSKASRSTISGAVSTSHLNQHSLNNGNLADRIQAIGRGQLRRLDVERDLSHRDSPTKRSSSKQQDLHWNEKSTPLLGRRNKRGASPLSDDEDGTLAILPPPVKRCKTQNRGAAFRAIASTKAASEMRTSFSGKSPSTELPEVHEDMSVAASYHKVLARPDYNHKKYTGFEQQTSSAIEPV